MSINSLEQTVNSLVKYFKLPTRSDLLESALKINAQEETPDKRVAQIILQSIDGTSSTKQIVEQLNTYIGNSAGAIETINDLIKICSTTEGNILGAKPNDLKPEPLGLTEVIGAIDGGVNGSDKINTSMSAICINNIKISPANRDINAVTLFFNSIPTIEMSRAVPFLDIEVQTNRNPLSQEGEIQTTSLMKFLNGAVKVEVGSVDEKLIKANSFLAKRVNEEGIDSDVLVSSAGMELFTASQTLINADLNDDATLFPTPILDKFRPLMSIDKLELNVHPAGGMMSSKTGKLYIVLHDRSRLSEIADLVKPDLFGHNELLIQYGWSHPDKSGDNVFGDLINSMRTKEKYTVTNVSFSFDEMGQVKIVITIAMKGAIDFFTAKISQGDHDVQTATHSIQKIIEQLAELKEGLFKSNFKFLKEIRGLTIIDAPSDLSTLPDLKEINKELKILSNKIKSSGAPKDATAFLGLLKKLYQQDGKTADRGQIGSLHNTIAKAVSRKMDMVAGIERTGKKTIAVEDKALQQSVLKVVKTISINKNSISKDPFLKLNGTQKDIEHLIGKKVSFGKLMMLFVGLPLREKFRFDDIQFIFYGFNANAGDAKNKNIAEFQIDVPDFKREFNKHALKRLSNDLPLWEFIEFLNNRYFDDFGNENYGMKDYFTFHVDKDTGAREAKPRVSRDQNKALNTSREQIMDGVEIPDGVFKIPMIEIYTECLPGIVVANSDRQDTKDENTILKIHIFDKQASSYEVQSALLQASRNNMIASIGNLGNSVNEDLNKHKVEFNDLLAKAHSAGIIEPFGGTQTGEGLPKVYQIVGGPRKLKEFLYETMPYIVYGAQNSIVKTFGAQTLNQPEQVTISMNRSGDANPSEPQGVEQGNLPLLMYPLGMNMNCLGCPLLQFGQQFFIDLGTGTSLDNSYAITELSHVIGAGTFETSAKVTPLDAYGQYRSVISTIGSALKQISAKT